MKSNLTTCRYLLSISFFLFQNTLSAQVPEPPSFPGDCVLGSSTNPIWYSGNQKLTSACQDVKVGIGTNYPTHSLHVIGEASIGSLVTSQIGIGSNTLGNVGLGLTSSGSGQFAMTHFKQIGVSPYKKMIYMELEDQ